MSLSVFPALLGCDIAVKRTPVWATMIQTAASGKELRAALWSAPRYKYQIPLNFARVAGFSPQTVSNEMAQINTLFHSVQGSWSTFLYTDPYSNTALTTSFGTGNASTTAFQLLDIEGYPIYYTNSTPSIYVNGTLQTVTTNYTISATGLVTFVAAPASSATITWSGTYYRQVRFDMDEFELSQIVNLAWGKGTIKLVSIK